MRNKSICLPMILAGLLPAANALGGPARSKDSAATATLPLAEVLKLHHQAREKTQAPAQPPPVQATLGRLSVKARLLDGAVEAKVAIRATALVDHWVEIPLIALDSAIRVIELPKLNNAYLAKRRGRLSLIAEGQGEHAFELSLILRAPAAPRRWQVSLRPYESTVAEMRLRFDEALFSLEAPNARRDGDDTILHPKDGRYAFSWSRRRPRSPNASTRARRMPLEPVIERGIASIVSTLDGQRITRLLYELRFEGRKQLQIEVPPGHQLKKLYLNGVSQTVARTRKRLAIEVEPQRTGGDSARLELVTAQAQRSYALSGKLRLALPKLSWTTKDLYATLHLPAVFTYRWVGGSLANSESAPTARFTYQIPTPGTTVRLHQQLVQSTPDAELDYAVDLEGKYFR